jgi:hypothetical protein
VKEYQVVSHRLNGMGSLSNPEVDTQLTNFIRKHELIRYGWEVQSMFLINSVQGEGYKFGFLLVREQDAVDGLKSKPIGNWGLDSVLFGEPHSV